MNNENQPILVIMVEDGIVQKYIFIYLLVYLFIFNIFLVK